MTDEQYTLLKEEYVSHIKSYVTSQGGLFPHLSIFADVKKPEKGEEDKPALIHIPIPDEYMEDDESKESFIKDVVPDLFSSIKKEFIPYGVAWAAEAWMRVADKKFDADKDDYKKLPIRKEVIIITIESLNLEEAFLYEIKREGKQVNGDGELTDAISLISIEGMDKPDGLGGRFSGLFKKFKNDVK
jgi:hypothetical protein